MLPTQYEIDRMPRPITPGTSVILHHGNDLVYTVFTGLAWSLVRLDIELGTCVTGTQDYRCFLEAKQAHDAGAIRWEERS